LPKWSSFAEMDIKIAEMDYLYKLDIKYVNVKELFYNIYHNFSVIPIT